MSENSNENKNPQKPEEISEKLKNISEDTESKEFIENSELSINKVSESTTESTVKTELSDNKVFDEIEISNNSETNEEVVIENEEEVPEKISILVRIRRAIPTFLDYCGFPKKILARFLGLYFILSAVNLFEYNKEKTNLISNWAVITKEINLLSGALWLAAGFVVLTIIHFIISCISKKYRIADELILYAGTLLFGCTMVWRTNNFYLAIAMGLVAVVIVAYLLGKERCKHSALEKIPTWLAGAIVFVTAIAVAVFVSMTAVANHKIFGTSTFDFGIFVQMYHSLVTDLSAVTTCERDKFLSHFYVHSSFIFYLLAPVYAIFKTESSLLIAQVVLAMAGIIPMFLIAKRHKFRGIPLIAVCFMYIFCLGIIAPCYYDFHENAFLPTILMWLIYAVDSRKYILTYIMAILTCLVKEDAPLYVICICMFMFFDEKSLKRINALVISILSGVYLMVITNWLANHGDGEFMTTTRFGHLITEPDQGLGHIVLNVLAHPAYFISTFIHDNTLLFFMQVLFPLLFLPFMTKKIHRFLLFIPFLIMNMVIGSAYGYATTMHYQYTFGPLCLLIYMSLLNCDDMTKRSRNTFVICAATVSIISSVCMFSGKLYFTEQYKEKKEQYIQMEECLDSIPQDVSVAAHTWYLPHVADRKEVYILDNADLYIDEASQLVLGINDMNRYDFFVFCVNGSEPYQQKAAELLEAFGYKLYNSVDGVMAIYCKPEYDTVK